MIAASPRRRLSASPSGELVAVLPDGRVWLAEADPPRAGRWERLGELRRSGVGYVLRGRREGEEAEDLGEAVCSRR